jgi:phosphopantothenoylcysteine decarboxylase/phosphopantothenate--cysteine ligase
MSQPEPSEVLNGKRIIVGVTGGIAIYKSCELVRWLIRSDAIVNVCMTDAAQKLVQPVLFEALSRNFCMTDSFPRIGDSPSAPFPHISPAETCDLFIIAPLTANTMAKLATGAADNLLTTLALALPKRAVRTACPAMNPAMWSAAPTQRNLNTLRADGWRIVGPDEGVVACGHTGAGRLADLSLIQADILQSLAGV